MADGSFIEYDVRDFYRMLGLKQYDIRIVKGPVASHSFVYNEDDFVKFCIRYNGARNIYVGINERKKDGTKISDVCSINNIFLDIDAVRKKGEIATMTSLEKALLVVGNVVEYLKSFDFITPKTVFSGNGYHLHMQIPPIEISDSNREEMARKLKIFGNIIRSKFSTRDVRIDSVFDMSRVVGVPGTLSVKEFPLLRRYVTIREREEDKLLREYIMSIKSPYSKEYKNEEINKNTNKKTKDDTSDGKLDYVIKTDRKFNELYKGNTTGYPSRSEAEMALIMKCLFYGLSPESVLCRSGIGKWNDASESYRRHSMERAFSEFNGRLKEVNRGVIDVRARSTEFDTGNRICGAETQQPQQGI